ncbi:MAG: hypothetical protein Fur0035_04500 [Anaerolineales bacterium]
MNILTLSNYYPEHTGGIEFVALNLVQRWRRNHTVRWMACETTFYHHVAVPDDIPLPALNFTEERLGFPYPLPLPAALPRILEQVRWCDVLHLHDCLYAANQIAFWAAQYYNKPVFVTQHVAEVPYSQPYKKLLQNLAYATLGKILLQNADGVVFISQRVQNWFSHRLRFRRPPRLIPNGVDRTLFCPPAAGERESARLRLNFSAEAPLLLFIGRFTAKKGLHIIQKMAAACPAWNWLLLGAGELDPAGWNLPNVRVLSPQPQADLRGFYLAADLLILPSAGEGFPLVVQEALACGLPAAISSETAAHLSDAPLIALNTKDLETTLQIITSLLSDPLRLTAMRLSAADYARRWDWDVMAAQHETWFAETLSSQPCA